MAQNIYDDPEFFAGYSRLRRQVQGLAGAPEWSVVRGMLPDLNGKRAVDLGCGFGWAARFMREHGARSVLGLDLSERMLERARADTDDGAIEYRSSDLNTLELPEATFDLAFSSLAFHYVPDFGRLIRMIRSSLVPGGQLLFTVEHPVFMATARPGWTQSADGRKSWLVTGYSAEGERQTDWFKAGVRKYHRTVATTLNTLIDVGFSIRRVEEFAPTAAQVQERPDLAGELERPMILMVSARV